MRQLTLLLSLCLTVLFAKEPQIIHGHQLPPEPDLVVNDSTLLGIDVNNNGVRDDVEIWILNKYKDKHPIYIDIVMQAGRAWQKVLEDPSKAKEIHDFVRAPGDCQRYYMNDAKYFNEPILVHERIITGYFIHKILFNTEEREKTFLQYNKLLSGGSYTLPRSEERKALCDFNTTKYEE